MTDLEEYEQIKQQKAMDSSSSKSSGNNSPLKTPRKVLGDFKTKNTPTGSSSNNAIRSSTPEHTS